MPTSETLASRGAALLHAQCWLWGQDLRSPRGDLLRAVGLERHAIEGARSHRTYYVEQLPAQFAVAWSGGLLFGDGSGTLFFPRLRFSPARLGDIRSPGDLGNLNARLGAPPALADTPGLEAATHAAIEWLATYEQRAAILAGVEWRARCAEVWADTEARAHELAAGMGVEYPPLPPLPSTGLEGAWRDLAGALVAG